MYFCGKKATTAARPKRCSKYAKRVTENYRMHGTEGIGARTHLYPQEFAAGQ
jgi:hypothetical protein